MVVILLGPPGVGKGTQAVRLAEELYAAHVSTGDLLRAARREGTELGKKAQAYMDAGELVPDDVILGMMREKLSSDEAAGGFLLDGFPRTVAQAEGLDDLLAGLDQELDAVVSLDVEDDEIVRRLSSRRVCAECGRVAPAGAEGHESCPACGGALKRRADDDPDTVRRRLEVYREETTPVLDWYERSPTPVRTVRGGGSVEEVQARIIEATAS